LRKSKKFPEQYVAARIKEITSALSYLHGMEVAHRDIKLENIVLSNVQTVINEGCCEAL
jgi:serine/threonine protein kinase